MRHVPGRIAYRGTTGEHCLRGLPRVPRGGGAGELLELPISSNLPLAARGVSEEWVRGYTYHDAYACMASHAHTVLYRVQSLFGCRTQLHGHHPS